MSNFSKRLIALRKERGWTQEQLAVKSDVSQQAISKIEACQRSPTEQTMAMIAHAFGLTLAEMLEPAGYPAQPPPKVYTGVILTETERQLLSDFRTLNSQGRDFVLKAMYAAVQSYSGKSVDITSSGGRP